MSLLRGLAERALGAARPVRSQRASPLHALQRDESVAELAPASEPASMTQPLIGAPAPVMSSQPDVAATVARAAPMHMATQAHVLPLVITHRAEPDATPPRRAMTKAARHAEAASPSRRNAARDPSPPAHADASMPDPEPLVTHQAPQPGESPPLRGMHATPPRRERQPARAAAVPAPTEVHVSIGRVELTALPAAAPPRAARPRDANARGLGDYLRGSRGRS
ncbi:hypothetical protein SRS16CHR_04129 [Variovorax sp. SRS16]|uniref:hypothetical protein n=1 Tax=Variovorax sp. SRS16 TaxID=282217 RepID=UPI001319B3AC|nr:hypothetical protein [Variovorax sp. SRS16]VTU27753.1 hypothetical protein SRS16CHR_04129 [Variovorax sp. SRS16]